ncbi:hypothetical protein CDO73_07425 [Saccharibacillus sp. O23]|uniref:DUF4181 domain-containing protein n=1 Tax=Saccharibacillus sp. O23 TaxID=2009338 RepID=UPI000B4E71A1|nr:DUF4181 domain-containing protein [Saccharibacillus sp. O23]OWR31546.1 hypothetical protein CDO73_07425 [Saccharibacillus sp. O23]
MLHIVYLYAFAVMGLLLTERLATKLILVLNDEELSTFKKEHLSQTDGYRVYCWGIGIGAAVLTVLWLLNDLTSVSPLIFVVTTLVCAFRAHLEKKYIPHTRKHRVSWITAAAAAAISCIFFAIWLVYFK